MSKYIATWVYLDAPEEKSKYPNTGGDSTTTEFQEVYWRCVALFYETSLRFHKDINHIFFSNTDVLPVVDGFSIKDFFDKNNIEFVTLKNLYPLPDGYFESFRNQFFEFSIINHISKTIDAKDMLILLDSDCVFNQSIATAFKELDQDTASAKTYVVNPNREYKLHGLTGGNMKELFEEFGVVMKDNPFYSGGELLFAKGEFFKNVADDFGDMYANLIQRHQEGRLKFNEEAHVLSYYYYKLDSKIGDMNSYIKRIWTNRNYYRNVKPEYRDLAIWHIPNEKRNGIKKLFDYIANGQDLKSLPTVAYKKLLFDTLLAKANYKLDLFKLFKSKAYKVMKKLKFIGK